MERDQTREIRIPVVCEVVQKIMEAIEPTRCTEAEEAIAVSVLSEWLDNRMAPEDVCEIITARELVLRLFPVTATRTT